MTTIFRINSCSLIVDNQQILSQFLKHLQKDKYLDVSSRSIYDSCMWPNFNLTYIISYLMKTYTSFLK